jgi:hypothetical protein
VALAALLIAALAVGARIAGVGGGSFDPVVRLDLAAGEWALCAGLVLAALLPFAAPRARLGVGRV